MKKSQTAAQIFVFLFALIVTSAILLFGYNMIKGLLEKEKKTELLMFERELSSEINLISSEYGSIKNLNLQLPSGFTGICFIDSTKVSGGECATKYPLIVDAWNTGNDVFLVPNGRVSFDVNTTIRFENENMQSLNIFAAGGRAKIVLEGKGGFVLIKPQQP